MPLEADFNTHEELVDLSREALGVLRCMQRKVRNIHSKTIEEHGLEFALRTATEELERFTGERKLL